MENNQPLQPPVGATEQATPAPAGVNMSRFMEELGRRIAASVAINNIHDNSNVDEITTLVVDRVKDKLSNDETYQAELRKQLRGDAVKSRDSEYFKYLLAAGAPADVLSAAKTPQEAIDVLKSTYANKDDYNKVIAEDLRKAQIQLEQFQTDFNKERLDLQATHESEMRKTHLASAITRIWPTLQARVENQQQAQEMLQNFAEAQLKAKGYTVANENGQFVLKQGPTVVIDILGGQQRPQTLDKFVDEIARNVFPVIKNSAPEAASKQVVVTQQEGSRFNAVDYAKKRRAELMGKE